MKFLISTLASLLQFIENGDEIIGDPINVDSIEDAEKLFNEYNSWSTLIPSKKAEHESLVALAQQMKQENINDFSGKSIKE